MSGGLAGGGSTEDELAKLRKDLDAVSEKVGLCREMLPHSPGIASDDALAEIVGFLEACKPRMDALVEAGLQGVLGEEMLAHCLKVSTDLQATLDAEKNGVPIEALQTGSAPAPTAAPAAAAPVSTPTLLDFGVDGGDDDEEEEGLSRTGGRKALGAKKLSPPIEPPPAATVPPPPAPAAAPPAAEPSLLDLNTAPTPVVAPPAPIDPFAMGASPAPVMAAMPAPPMTAPGVPPPVMPPATMAMPPPAMMAPNVPPPDPFAAPATVMPPPVPMAAPPAAMQQGDDFDELLKMRNK